MTKMYFYHEKWKKKKQKNITVYKQNLLHSVLPSIQLKKKKS